MVSLELAATDMELSLRCDGSPRRWQARAAVVVPGKLLSEPRAAAPRGEVVLQPPKGRSNVTSGSYTSRLHTYAAEDFPRLPESDLALDDPRRTAAAGDDRPRLAVRRRGTSRAPC